MGTYTMEELIRRWYTDQLTVEQAVGQIMLLLKELAERVLELERVQFHARQTSRKATRRAAAAEKQVDQEAEEQEAGEQEANEQGGEEASEQVDK